MKDMLSLGWKEVVEVTGGWRFEVCWGRNGRKRRKLRRLPVWGAKESHLFIAPATYGVQRHLFRFDIYMPCII